MPKTPDDIRTAFTVDKLKARITSSQVAEYLLRHPQFLVRHPDLLDYQIPPARNKGEGIIDLQQFMVERLRRDIAKLREAIVAFFQKDLVEAELFLPWSAQKLRGEIFSACQVLEERAGNEGTFFRIRGELEAVQRLREQVGAAS